MSIRSTPVYRSRTHALTQPTKPFHHPHATLPHPTKPLPVLHKPNQKAPSSNKRPRHFDRSCSQSHREERSGEICFSTPTVTQPRPPRRTCCCSCVVLSPQTQTKAPS